MNNKLLKAFRILGKVAAVLYGFAGALLVAYGIYEWWPPGAYMFLGTFIVIDSYMISRSLNVQQPHQT